LRRYPLIKVVLGRGPARLAIAIDHLENAPADRSGAALCVTREAL
jgi:hypothetical protein